MIHADVAVVVPVYNRASLVLETLNSVARQSVLPRRLLIVDDGSTDGTVEAVADWLATTRPAFEALLVRQPRNGGASAARNRGLAMARDCRYIAFLDSDDSWPADFVERASGALASHPEAVAASSDRLHFFDGPQAAQHVDMRPIARNATCWLFANHGGIGSATMFATREIFELGGYNENLPTGHDSDLFLPLSLRGPWLHVPGSPVAFRCHLPRNRAEMGHLADEYSDNQRRWARIHEDFIERKGGKRVLPRGLYTRALANRWTCAADQLLQAGRIAEARQCLLRSLRWRPGRLSVWSQWLNTYAPWQIRRTNEARTVHSTKVDHSSFVLRHSLDIRH